MHLARLMLPILASLVAMPAFAQQGPIPLSSFPSSEAVLAAVEPGSDEIDTASRHKAALDIFKRLLEENTLGRNYTNRWLPGEREIRQRYAVPSMAIQKDIQARYAARDLAAWKRFLNTSYWRDASFQQALLGKFGLAAYAGMLERKTTHAGSTSTFSDETLDLVGVAIAQGVVLLGLALLGWLAWRSTRPLAISLPGQFVAGGRLHKLYHAAGLVSSHTKFSESHTSGQVSQGQGSISTSITRHDQFVLEKDDGRQVPLRLSDFDVVCEPGHALAVIWAIRKRKERGPYFLVHNYVTDETLFHDPSLAEFVNPRWLWLALVALTVAAVGYLFVDVESLAVLLFVGILAIVPFTWLQRWITLRRARAFKARPEWSQLLEDIRPEGAAFAVRAN